MKKLWLLVGFMGSVFVSVGAPSGAASPRADGFHGRFVGHHGGPAFRMTRGARGDFSRGSSDFSKGDFFPSVTIVSLSPR